jgi:hypothetical protein
MSTPNFNGAGLTLILNENNNYSILMAKSNSTKPHKRNTWIFPGGKKNESEVPHQTAYREFVEEVFNVVVDKVIIDEIITLITEDKSLYPINTLIPNSNSLPSYTFMQSADSITHFVNVLHKHGIKSDVFPFGYNGLYNLENKINVYQFCLQRRYIADPVSIEKNEYISLPSRKLKNTCSTCNKKY